MTDTPGSDGDGSTAQSPEQPEVKQKHAGGRKPKGYYERGVQDILDGTAPHAARRLQDLIEQKKGSKNMKSNLQRACEYVIDHAVGKARQKIEHSGGIMTYGELARSADALDKKPRRVLADVEEIANKHDPAPVSSEDV